MKRMLTALWLPMALSIVITAGAAPKQDQSGQSDKDKSSKQHKMTLTGCVQQGTEPNSYMLTNVTSDSARSKSDKAPSEMARAESSYILVPENSTMDLSKHVGHRVRVTGSIEDKGMTDMSSQSSQSSSSQTSSSNATRFDVKSIKHVSDTCQ